MNNKPLFEDKDITLDKLPNNDYRVTLFDDNHWHGEIHFNKDNITYNDTSLKQKVYVIINKSHKWDDYIDEVIEYIGTDYEDTYYEFSKLAQICAEPNEKWCYEYELWEYTTGLEKYDKGFKKLLCHLDNCIEE